MSRRLTHWCRRGLVPPQGGRALPISVGVERPITQMTRLSFSSSRKSTATNNTNNRTNNVSAQTTDDGLTPRRMSLQFQRQQQREIMRQKSRQQQQQQQQRTGVPMELRQIHPLQKLPQTELAKLLSGTVAAAAAAAAAADPGAAAAVTEADGRSNDTMAISWLHKELVSLQRQIAQEGLDQKVPVWQLQSEQRIATHHDKHAHNHPYYNSQTSSSNTEEQEQHVRDSSNINVDSSARQQQLQQPVESSTAVTTNTVRWQIFHRAIEIQKALELHLDRKVIRPATKHRREFVALTERLLHVFSCCGGGGVPEEGGLGTTKNEDTLLPPNPFDDCVVPIMGQLRQYGLELTHSQCHAVVSMAAQAGRWDTAAQLYMGHIDPDQSGFLPVTTMATTSHHTHNSSATTTSSHSALFLSSKSQFTITGLYCMARASMDVGMLPVESVLDGVRNLSLVSPLDSQSYILAAGVALGHAGEWEALRNYLKSSYKSSQLGQPLVAATMHACVLCHKYDEALELFDELVNGELASASEWQWGGGVDRLHPASRDLAMRALGSISIDRTTSRQSRILQLFRDAQDEESNVSVEALCAVVLCYKNDWETVTSLFLSTMNKNPTSWLVFGDDCRITTEPSQEQYDAHELIPELGIFLDHVMKICNAAKKFGTSLLCLRLFDISMASFVAVPYHRLIASTGDETPGHSEIVVAALPTIYAMTNRQDLVTTTMVSLCGVKLPQLAINLFDVVASLTKKETPLARYPYDVYSYAEALAPTFDPSVTQGWEIAHRHIHRLTATFAAISDNIENLSSHDHRMLSSALAVTLRECVSASDPEAGILLGRWIEKRNVSIGQYWDATFSQDSLEECRLPMPLTDSLLSAAVEAFVQCGTVGIAENLIQSQLQMEKTPNEWILSYHEAVKFFFSQGHIDEGLELFRTTVSNGVNPALFCTAARTLLASGSWRPVLDLYRQSLVSGCFSEELSLLTMEAIAASGRVGQKDGQFPLLRSIIAETAKSLGTTPAAWVETNYWKLKRILGFSVARLIMGWDDYKRSRLDELDLAVETLEKRSISGLTAKNAVLFLIVQAIANFEQHHVPYNATGLPKVPRDRDAWVKLLERTIHEARSTRLFYEPNFVIEVVIALHRVGCHTECLDTINNAVSRDMKLNRAALECAVQAATIVGLEGVSGDVHMLLDDGYQ